MNNELCAQYLIDLYDKQNGLGYCSGMKMVYTIKSDWKASPMD